MHEYASCRSVPGVLAQSEACVLSKDEVLGSKPRYSTVFFVGRLVGCAWGKAKRGVPEVGFEPTRTEAQQILSLPP